jgi:hypothetical protein
MAVNHIRRIEKLEQLAESLRPPGKHLVRWLGFPEDWTAEQCHEKAREQLAAMRASGKLGPRDRVTFVRWLTKEEGRQQEEAVREAAFHSTPSEYASY